MRAPVCTLLVALVLACDPGQPVPPFDADIVLVDLNLPVEFDDADEDGISDAAEGRPDVDTDGDGTPDYLDLDADGDGLGDALENGGPSNGVPRDADADGVPNFRDDDSDGNGILDADEGDGDIDDDGTIDAADLDDDADTLPDIEELAGSPSDPPDFDDDGVPDFRDLDSDNDFIGDNAESNVDTDRDLTPDRFDADSDNDGWADADEAGDEDLSTAPVDTDRDGDPDFRDPDADNDGLGDADERERGTDRTRADTDGDGVTDLVEVVACPGATPDCVGDPLDPNDSPRARGDFVFAVPFQAPPSPTRDTLDFATSLRVADVYFLIDTTGSMGGAIDNVQESLLGEDGVIAEVRTTIEDTFFGVGELKDYSVGPSGAPLPYGGEDDFAYRNVLDLSGDDNAVQAAVDALAEGGGGDGPESHVPALFAVATGGDLPGASLAMGESLLARTGCPAGSVGYPCFRSGAVPIVVLISDALMHNGPEGTDPYDDAVLGGASPTYDEAVEALSESRIRVITVAVRASGSSNPVRAQMAALATDTGAVDGTQLPLSSPAPDGLVSAAVINQIRTLANQTVLDISLEYEDDASDAVETRSAFVDRIEANVVGDVGRGCAPRTAVDANADGVLDTFLGVRPGDPVCFDIVPRENVTVPPTDEPQLYRATLRVLGDGFTELDARDIFFLVPPEVGIGDPD